MCIEDKTPLYDFIMAQLEADCPVRHKTTGYYDSLRDEFNNLSARQLVLYLDKYLKALK